MLENTKVLQVRRVTEEDTAKIEYGYDYFRPGRCCHSLDYVKAGDCVAKLAKEYSSEGIDICSDVDGYIIYPRWGTRIRIGDPIFYILENDDLRIENWDKSQLRIEAELIDGRYYYSLYGLPKRPTFELGGTFCNIILDPNDPTWVIKCTITNQHLPSSICITKSESFRIKLKNGSKSGRKYSCLYGGWQEEEDGEHLCIKYFAIGYPKKSQIAKESIHTLNSTDSGNSNEDACYVYVMRNNDNGAYKIGISKNPGYREHTLQSQEPDITCIFQLEFPTRDIARLVERSIHEEYAGYRLRGEWFSIPREMIYTVIGEIVMYGRGKE